MRFLLALLLGSAALWPQKTEAALTSSIEPPQAASNVNANDLDIMARTIWGEARGEGYTGMQAVANVIMNRYKAAQQSEAKARQFGRTITEICKKKYQFSAWLLNDPNRYLMENVTQEDLQFRTALEIARKALSGQLADITGGADHYHTMWVSPYWSDGLKPIASIGSHNFYRLA